MAATDPYRTQLREALVNAVPVQVARERRRANRRRIAVAFAVVLAVVTGVVTIALPDERADARIDVEVRDDRVFVRLLDFETRPDEIVAALRNAGVSATVELVPVGPSNVGRFVGLVMGANSGFEITEGTQNSYRAFSVKAGFTGMLALKLGRLGGPGELWLTVSNATAPGEALACRELIGLSAADAAAALTGLPLSIRWLAVPNTFLTPETFPAHSNWRVIDAVATAMDAVIVRLTHDGSWPYLIDQPPRIDPRCKGR